MTTQFVSLDKKNKKAMQFVKLAASKDYTRPVLTGVVLNGGMLASDGMRIHYADVNDTGLEGLYHVDKVSDVVTPELLDGKFPDVSTVYPRGKPAFVFGINPKFIADMAKSCDGELIIKVYDPTSPIEIHGMIDDTPVYALIMPMRIDEKTPTEQVRPH